MEEQGGAGVDKGYQEKASWEPTKPSTPELEKSHNL